MFKIIRKGHVFSPQDLGKTDILICQNKIAGIAKDFSRLTEQFKVETIDVDGKIVVPGFLDQHVHFLGGGDVFGPGGATTDITFSSLVESGITTAVGCLGSDDVAKNLPDLMRRAQDLESIGITTYIYTGSFNVPSPTLTGSVQKDLIMVDKVLGVKIAISEPMANLASTAEFGDAAKDAVLGAKIAGKKGVVHIHVGRKPERLKTLFELLELTGISIEHFIPTHVNRTEQDVMNQTIRFLKMGGRVDLTANMYREAGHLTGIRPDLALKEILSAGVPIERVTMSSDGNVSMPVLDKNDNAVGLFNVNVEYLPKMLFAAIDSCGLPLSEGLKMVTSNVAQTLGLQKQKGEIAVGKDADLVILDKKFQIHTVMARGCVVVADGKAVVRGCFENTDNI